MKEKLITHDGYFDHYYFVEPGSDYAEVIWRDIGLLDNATLFPSPLRRSNALLQFLHHAHFSFTLGRFVNPPFQRIWTKRYALSQVMFNEDKKYCVIFTDISACRTDRRYLEALHRQENIVMVMVMANVVSRKERLLKERFACFDYVISWDMSDVEKYHMIYHPPCYSKIGIPDSREPFSDCFFVGNARDRLQILHEIYRRVTTAGGKAEFYITGVGKKAQTEAGIHYNQVIPYSSVLAKDLAANCIIEVVAGGQVGSTLRAEEAIISNKKLLTNNVHMKESPYYKSGFIRVFTNLCDEDIDFILKKENVDYGYRDDYSPILLIDHINALEEERAKRDM